MRFLITTLACAWVSGCTLTAPRYTPSAENVQLLRDSGAGQAKVGRFDAGPTANDDAISIRFHRFVSPVGGRFTEYLESALSAELCAARRLDSETDLEIDGVLLRNTVDVWGWSKGSALMQARIVVRRGDEVLFDKVKCADVAFHSSFHGWVAIPRGERAYPRLVQQFLLGLYSDKDFVSALGSARGVPVAPPGADARRVTDSSLPVAARLEEPVQ